MYNVRNKLIECWFNTSQKHTPISNFKIPKVKSGMSEHKNQKKNI